MPRDYIPINFEVRDRRTSKMLAADNKSRSYLYIMTLNLPYAAQNGALHRPERAGPSTSTTRA
jgi:hypothetical protein